MVYKYIYAVMRRNTNSRPPQYEKPSLYKYCAFGNIVLRTGGLVFFFPLGLSQSLVKLPFCKGTCPVSRDGFPWQAVAKSCQGVQHEH